MPLSELIEDIYHRILVLDEAQSKEFFAGLYSTEKGKKVLLKTQGFLIAQESHSLLYSSIRLTEDEQARLLE